MKIFRIILLISVGIFTSCDLLTTRTPEEPISRASSFIPASDPPIIFQNMKSSFDEKITENYMACLVDSAYLNKKFSFIPAAGTVAKYPSLNLWGLKAEQQYFNNLRAKIQQGSKVSFIYSITQSDRLGDSAFYFVDYNINLSGTNSQLDGSYSGTSRFKVFQDSRNQWVIVEWLDNKKSNDPCWSELKGRAY